jgi:hypothetical protein
MQRHAMNRARKMKYRLRRDSSKVMSAAWAARGCTGTCYI